MAGIAIEARRIAAKYRQKAAHTAKPSATRQPAALPYRLKQCRSCEQGGKQTASHWGRRTGSEGRWVAVFTRQCDQLSIRPRALAFDSLFLNRAGWFSKQTGRLSAALLISRAELFVKRPPARLPLPERL
jgi:hypothetical protein